MATTADPRRTNRGVQGRGGEGRVRDPRQAVFVISVAAELAGVHPQTLRIYERKGLLDPARTGGGARRYSEADISQLRRILDLTNEGLNLAGVKRVLALEAEVDRLRESLTAALDETRDAVDRTHRRYRRDLVPLSQAVELFGRDPR
jgi:MerR family transcriptional regulator/heat shock protein HspR